MIEEKHLTAEAQDKMSYDSMFLVYPNFMRGVPFTGLADMADGKGGFLSDIEIESLSNNKWRALPLGGKHLFVMYDFDGLTEIALTKQALVNQGLIDILGLGYISDVVLDNLIYNGFLITTKRGINKLQELIKNDEPGI